MKSTLILAALSLCTVSAVLGQTTKPAGGHGGDVTNQRMIIRSSGPGGGAMVHGGQVQIAPGQTFQIAPGQGMMMTKSMSNDNGVNTTSMTDGNGRQMELKESDDGITVTITEPGGDPKVYTAKDEAELKKEYPEAYEAYEKLSDDGMSGDDGHEPVMMVQGSNISGLGLRVSPVMDMAVKAQLGTGLFVRYVKDESRAGKMGLKLSDLIVSIDGKPVKSVKDIRAAVEGKDKIKMEVLREAKPVKLAE